jgi:hypothetical protein
MVRAGSIGVLHSTDHAFTGGLIGRRDAITGLVTGGLGRPIGVRPTTGVPVPTTGGRDITVRSDTIVHGSIGPHTATIDGLTLPGWPIGARGITAPMGTTLRGATTLRAGSIGGITHLDVTTPLGASIAGTMHLGATMLRAGSIEGIMPLGVTTPLGASIAGTMHRGAIMLRAGSIGGITPLGVTMLHGVSTAGTTLPGVTTPRAGLIGVPSELHAGSISRAKSAASTKPRAEISG